ncbi:MAG TPA: translocation/assembly module TamB domain-containing protein, partial [Cyclobacteriaceae bacterium]|nr:translocation/assembly module TamB domain-containing protein [Cyclobacteriaceae bacterium]
AKTRIPEAYQANFDFNIKNIRPVSNLLKLDLAVGQNIKIQGKFSNGNTTIIQAFTNIDSLAYENILLSDTEIEINASKVADSTETLAMAYLYSTSQNLEGIKTKNLITEAIWDSGHIDFNVSIDQQARDNYLRLKGLVDFRDSTEIKFDKSSKVQLLEKVWTIDSANRLALKGKEWSFQHLKWISDEQSVTVDGRISEDPSKKINLFVQNFNLATINSILQRELSGHVNAEITVNKVYEQPELQNEIAIHQLKVDNFLIGNITGNNVWDPVDQKFVVEFIIDRMDKKIIDCSGYYNPANKISPLFITAKLEQANLKIVEPFIDQIFSNIDGTLSGSYSLTGTLQKPIVKGEGQIEKGLITVNYLKTTYQLAGTIGLRPNAIYFENIELTDPLRNKGKLNGEIIHQNFHQMEISLNADFKDLQLLNTSARDNSLFYGQGYASGDVSFKGPISNLIITANATTRKNTRIYIPMASSSSTERKEFINFVNLNDSTYQAGLKTEIAKKVNLTGITFDLNLNVTPDAYCEIIFDIKAGDIIRGRGNGRVKLQLDTKGEFNMFGPVVFTEGGYNFTLYDIINKEFKIVPGGSITWYGDPYQGAMRINATYDQLASYSPILNDPSLSSVPQIRRKYPVKVLLKLDGPMLSPQIEFDILSKDLPKSIPVEGRPAVRLEDEFIAFKSKLDEQELKRQVFSLIVLRKFSPADAFNTSGTLVNSVSELFSNQLSYWMSQVDENLEIDVDLGTMDQEAYNAFQLRLSYTFLNGRLRVTRDGTFGNTGNSNSTTTENTGNNYSSVIGDWTVDYLLTPDGKFKVKMYSRQNVNPINTGLNSQNAITTGVSLLYTQSFNELKDLLKSSRDKNRRKPEDDPELNEEATKENEGDN